jgi:hypothetical protein
LTEPVIASRRGERQTRARILESAAPSAPGEIDGVRCVDAPSLGGDRAPPSNGAWRVGRTE